MQNILTNVIIYDINYLILNRFMIQKRQILPKTSQKKKCRTKKVEKVRNRCYNGGEMYMALNLKNGVVLQERLFMVPNR